MAGVTAGELLARIEQDVSTAGNAYIRRATPADGSDDQLVQMRPDTVTIVSEEIRDSAGRVWRRPRGYEEDTKSAGLSDREPQFFTVDEVAHYSPIPDPMVSFKGMSWLTAVLREVGADVALTEYKTTHVQNGAHAGPGREVPPEPVREGPRRAEETVRGAVCGPVELGENPCPRRGRGRDGCREHAGAVAVHGGAGGRG